MIYTGIEDFERAREIIKENNKVINDYLKINNKGFGMLEILLYFSYCNDKYSCIYSLKGRRK